MDKTNVFFLIIDKRNGNDCIYMVYFCSSNKISYHGVKKIFNSKLFKYFYNYINNPFRFLLILYMHVYSIVHVFF